MKRFILFPLLLTGCKSFNPIPAPHGTGLSSSIELITPSESLTVLSATGSLCLIAGMILLIVTGGRKGWYPTLGGGILVVLNYAVAQYSDWLFYPLVFCTTLISCAWTYKVIKQILLEKILNGNPC